MALSCHCAEIISLSSFIYLRFGLIVQVVRHKKWHATNVLRVVHFESNPDIAI